MGCDYYGIRKGKMKIRVDIYNSGEKMRTKTFEIEVEKGDAIYIEKSGDIRQRE